MDRIRRFLGTLFGFVLFGVAGLLFRLMLLPYTRRAAVLTVGEHLAARRLVGRVWRFFVRYLEWSGVLSVRFHGAERLGRPGQLVLSNHPSLLDVVLLISRVPQLNCIVKKDLLDNPVMKSPIIAAGFIPNTESEAMLNQVDTVLKGGESLLVFPEGTRTGWDGVVRMHRGAVSMGLRSAAVMTPVVIKMTPPNFKKGQPWYRIPARKIHYEITVGEDIDPRAWLAQKPLPIAARRLNDYLQQYFTEKTQ
ncbi:1-acyl-sn-glycerol-3-phosphate acyltransferase [Neisseria leonii]|uniref:lysophospholipid acyltransferase family protein n=1 Tax=Neisseria leonii TaxID=2995413 RepID=UPI00237C27CA|nr:lysophospholipid acyltransferase family protein [Neisseria sp. 3986]MDD9325703.1 1-acyl-sn-glycerol-3-phosphate acyltransferase [Neisseria sp. 3986]